MSTWLIPRMRDTLGAEPAPLKARIAHRLPVIVLAWTLALLVAPALASAACDTGPGVWTFTDVSNDHTWENPANWMPTSVPVGTSPVCIPSDRTASVAATDAAADVNVEGTLTITATGHLNVASGVGSSVTGGLTVDGTMTVSGQTLTLAPIAPVSISGTLEAGV